MLSMSVFRMYLKKPALCLYMTNAGEEDLFHCPLGMSGIEYSCRRGYIHFLVVRLRRGT